MPKKDGVRISQQIMAGEEGLEHLGIDPNAIVVVRGVSLVGGGMWGDTPPPAPIATVIVIPRDMDGNDLEPLAIVQSAAAMRQLRDKFYEVFTLAAEAAEEMFENGGNLSVPPEA